MRGTIIYQSKYRTTKKYSKWLKKANEYFFEKNNINSKKNVKFDTKIFGGEIWESYTPYLKKNINVFK